MKKVLYFNMPSGSGYEQELIKAWGVHGLEIVEMNGEFSPEVLQGYAGLVTEYIEIGEDVFKKTPDLEIIALQSIGYNEIDAVAAEKYNIAVTNAPGYCSEDVATHAMALLLSVVRQTAMFNREVKSGKWDCFSGIKMERLSGKKAGLISFGNIPQRVVSMLKGFGVEVYAYDMFKDADFMAQRGAIKVDDLKEILSICDYVLLHTPLVDETFHMINAETIACMKDGAILINASRGALVCEEDLISALKSGKIAGAGLDVLEDEQNRTSPLLEMDNVTITPHVAFLSEDSLRQSREMALKQLIERLCENKVPELCVNNITVK